MSEVGEHGQKLPIRDIDGWVSTFATPFDPWYSWKTSKPYHKYVMNFLTKPEYTVWDLYGNIWGYVSITEKLDRSTSAEPKNFKPHTLIKDPTVLPYAYDKKLYPTRNVIEQDYYNSSPTSYGLRPFYNTFLTDILKTFVLTWDLPCNELEIKALDCLEYHGTRQGMHACEALYEDFVECEKKPLRNLRRWAIMSEQNKRYVEYRKGQREWSEVYKPNPKSHAFDDPIKKPADFN